MVLLNRITLVLRITDGGYTPDTSTLEFQCYIHKYKPAEKPAKTLPYVLKAPVKFLFVHLVSNLNDACCVSLLSLAWCTPKRNGRKSGMNC